MKVRKGRHDPLNVQRDDRGLKIARGEARVSGACHADPVFDRLQCDQALRVFNEVAALVDLSQVLLVPRDQLFQLVASTLLLMFPRNLNYGAFQSKHGLVPYLPRNRRAPREWRLMPAACVPGSPGAHVFLLLAEEDVRASAGAGVKETGHTAEKRCANAGFGDAQRPPLCGRLLENSEMYDTQRRYRDNCLRLS